MNNFHLNERISRAHKEFLTNYNIQSREIVKEIYELEMKQGVRILFDENTNEVITHEILWNSEIEREFHTNLKLTLDFIREKCLADSRLESLSNIRRCSMELDPNNLSDDEECEFWFAQKLTSVEKRALNLANCSEKENLPQRENYLSPLDFISALKKYANELINKYEKTI